MLAVYLSVHVLSYWA